MAEIEKEKEGLKNELMDCKERLSKFSHKEKKLKKYIALLVESEKYLEGKYDEMERKLQENEKELEDRIMDPITQSGELDIVQDMSQVSLEDLELVGLGNQNKTLDNMASKSEQEKKTWESNSNGWEEKCQELHQIMTN